MILALAILLGANDERAVRALDVIRASQPAPTYDDHLHDVLTELAIALKSQTSVAPIAVLLPTVSGLAPEAGARLRVKLEHALKDAALEEAFCDPCADQALALLAKHVGAAMFLRTHLEWQRTRLVLEAMLVSADGRIAWAKRFESDEKRAALVDRGMMSVDAYAEEMSKQLPKKTSFGLAAIAGILSMPYKVTVPGLADIKGSINGIMFAFRFYEAFGYDRSLIVGAEARGFIDTEFQRNLPPNTLQEGVSFPASGGMFTGVIAYAPPFAADLRAPRLRLGGEVGVFLGGSLGNNVVAGGIIELLVHRFGLNVALLYVGESKSVLGPVNLSVGGFTYAAGGSFNWD